MQELQDTLSTSKDKRSLRDIQEEERARQQEADFLKWWTREEERVRVEMLEQEQARGGTGSKQHSKNKGGKTKPRKPQVEAQPETLPSNTATAQRESRNHRKLRQKDADD